jgi:hypothetical protein
MAITQTTSLKESLKLMEAMHSPINSLKESVEAFKLIEWSVPGEFTRTIQELNQVLKASSLAEATQQVAGHLAFLNTPLKKKVSTIWGDIYLPVIVIEPKLNGCVLSVNHQKTRIKPSLAAILKLLWDEQNHSRANLIKSVYGSNYTEAKDLRKDLSKRISDLNVLLDKAFGHSKSEHGLKRRWIERIRGDEGSFYQLTKPRGKN